MILKGIGVFIGIVASVVISSSAVAGTMDDVKSRGYLKCGVSTGLPGFSNPDKDGKWSGIDVDLCRAVAVAVLGDADKVKYTPLSGKERLISLLAGEVDILSRSTTFTFTRDTALGLNFAGVNYYDGQSFMLRKDLEVNSIRELGGAAVCVIIGTTSELNLSDYFRANKMDYRPVNSENYDDALKEYSDGKCDALTTDQSSLAGMRLKLKDPDSHVILPELISKEPLGPVVRHQDDHWFDIVKWTLFVMLEAEENGVNMGNVDRMKKSKIPTIRRLLGVEGGMGKKLGLANDWAYAIIKHVGNYRDSFERHVGPNTPLQLPRGLNRLWTDGGLMYPMPFR